MPLPRVRFTVRRMMAGVAVAGFLIWGIRLRRLAVDYRERAGLYGVSEVIFRRSEMSWPSLKRKTEYLRYLHDLREKYEYAARHPFLLVAPDPPEPR